MNRYENIGIIKNSNNINRYSLSFDITINDNDEFYYIHNEDRINYSLIKLARQYYNDGKLWWIIAKANNVKLPHNYNHEHIRIPKNLNKVLDSIK